MTSYIPPLQWQVLYRTFRWPLHTCIRATNVNYFFANIFKMKVPPIKDSDQMRPYPTSRIWSESFMGGIFITMIYTVYFIFSSLIFNTFTADYELSRSSNPRPTAGYEITRSKWFYSSVTLLIYIFSH